MNKSIKSLLLGIGIGALGMLACVCLLGWQYEMSHPASEEIIVVDSIPTDTAVYLGTHGGNTIRK